MRTFVLSPKVSSPVSAFSATHHETSPAASARWWPWLGGLLLGLALLLAEQSGTATGLRSQLFGLFEPTWRLNAQLTRRSAALNQQWRFWRRGANHLAKLENALLQQQIDQQELARLRHENAQLRAELDLPQRPTQPILAFWYGSGWDWYVNRGCRQGVQTNEAVIVDERLVGQVVQVWPQYSRVQIVTDPNWSFPVVVATASGSAHGLWQNTRGQSEVQYVSQRWEIPDRALVSTAGQGPLPPHLAVGTISAKQLAAGFGVWQLTAAPATNVTQLSHVYILRQSTEETCL